MLFVIRHLDKLVIHWWLMIYYWIVAKKIWFVKCLHGISSGG